MVYSPLAFLVLSAFAQDPSKLENGLYTAIETSMGTIKAKLLEKDAPATVKNFVDLALGRTTYIDPRNSLPSKKPFYNGLTFHRVIPGFMIQGGDPLGDGTGGTRMIPDEILPEIKFDVPGRLAMANAGPNTGSCQFFLTEAPSPHLDGLHTIFGQVVEGQDIIAQITKVPTENDRPVTAVKIVKISIERIGPEPEQPKPLAAKKSSSHKK